MPGQNDLQDAICIIPDKLYWVALSTMPSNTQTTHYFNIDNDFVYEGFFGDFGPLNLGWTYRFVRLIEKKLKDNEATSMRPARKVVHYTSNHPHRRANAATLMTCYMVMKMNMTGTEAWRYFESCYPPFVPYRDACCGTCEYQCTVEDCANGIAYAKKLGWFNMDTFDLQSYEWHERVENGDMNWIIPNRFLAFAGPAERANEDGFPMYTPQKYIEPFKKLGITLVLRLNKKQYHRSCFTDAGIKHADLYFLDGSCPPKEIFTKFLQITENEPGAIAVHCKAGLGRTGSLIGIYAMKHFKFPPRAWVAWNRYCRPGSILGPQQQWLSEVADYFYALGDRMPRPLHPDPANLMGHVHNINYNNNTISVDSTSLLAMGKSTPSIEDGAGTKFEDKGQGERLMAAKMKQQNSPKNATYGNPGNDYPTILANGATMAPQVTKPSSRVTNLKRTLKNVFQQGQ